jgi:hypothetical protein
VFAPEYFSLCDSHPRIHRTSDVFAEAQRYFCGNSVSGSKSRRIGQTVLTQFDLNFSEQTGFEDQ